MSEAVLKSYEVARSRFMKAIEALDVKIVDVQPEGFNNTIHWHIGHVLTVSERFLFGFPQKSDYLPQKYMELFAPGTKPSDWQGDVPSISELSGQLQEQLERLKEIPAESLTDRLQKPFLGLETFGEIITFSLFHEGLHLGQIQAMARIITASQAK